MFDKTHILHMNDAYVKHKCSFYVLKELYRIYIYVYTCISGKPLMIVHHDSEEMPPGMNEQLVDAFDICLSDRVASIVE